MKASIVLWLTLVCSLVACTASPVPSPTADTNRLATQIAASIFATQTASAPKVTNTPLSTDTRAPTNTPSAMPSTSPTKPSNEIAVTASDNDKTIVVAQNQVIVLTLNSNPSTGYRWKYITEPDARILKFVSSEYIPSNTSATPLVGAGGTDVWTFQAIGSGTTSLKLGYFPPANPNQAANTFEIKVTVK